MKLLQGEDGINDTALAKKLQNAPRDQVRHPSHRVIHIDVLLSCIENALFVCVVLATQTKRMSKIDVLTFFNILVFF